MFEELTLWNWLTIASFVVNLVTLVLVLVLLTKKKSSVVEQKASTQVAASKEQKQVKVSGVVFCRNCGKQFDSSQSACPNCHTQR
jgi:predicted Zn-ribbon and HTH transcriptional regulator